MPETNGNGSKNVPWWVSLIGTIGVPGFIALYVLGAVPGLPSPIDRAITRMEQATDTVNTDHRDITRVLWQLKAVQDRLLDVQRTTCRGIWKGNPDMQAQCDGPAPWLDRSRRPDNAFPQ